MIAFLVACATPEPPPPEQPVIPTALDEGAFRFCHTPGAGGVDVVEWCELLQGTPPERCPGLRETCAKGSADPEPRGCEPSSSGGSRSDRLAGAPDTPPEPWKGCEDLDVDSLTSLARWIAAIAVAIGILILLRVVWATFGGRRRQVPAEGTPIDLAEPVADALPDVPDVPSDDLLSRARSALAAGRTGEAVLLARGAALRHLGERGRVRLHRSSTDREYARAVRGDGEVADPLRVVLGATEDHRFGGRDVGAERAGAAIVAAERILALAAVLLALLCAPGEARAQNRHQPEGDAALLRLFQLHGYDVGWRLTSLADLDEDDDVLVLDLSAVLPAEEHWTAMRAWVEAGAVLVVGGDASAGFPELGTWEPPDAVRGVARAPLVEAAIPAPRWPNGAEAGWTGGLGRTIVAGVGPDGTDACALVELLDVGSGVVVAIADPRLLWNAALVHPDNEAFLGEIVYAGQSLEGWPVPTPARVQLATLGSVTAESSSGANNPFRSLGNARLLAFVLQLLATFALIALWRGWPFAPLKDPPDEGRIGFVEHVEAHGRRWARLRASAYAAHAMASLEVSRLGPAGLRFAAERAGYAPDAAGAWVAEVEARAAGTPRASDAAADHAWMEELWRVTRGRSR